MKKVTVTVGGTLQDDAAAFIQAWKRAKKNSRSQERRLAFESWEALSHIMTARRLELLRHVHHTPPASIAVLARQLGRDYKRVHQDVDILAQAGLIERNHGLRADYDTIQTVIAL